jgi:putative protease
MIKGGMMENKPIGVVTHYYGKPGVAVVKLNKGAGLKKGDKVQIKGHSVDFTQTVSSMQVEHADVEEVKAGDDFGMKVDQKVHEGDQLYAA